MVLEIKEYNADLAADEKASFLAARAAENKVLKAAWAKEEDYQIMEDIAWELEMSRLNDIACGVYSNPDEWESNRIEVDYLDWLHG